jgi:hypothetical protein
MIPFLGRYWRWILLLAFTNWLIWMAFELIHSKDLGYRDLWPIRVSLASGLLLFDNLCVLWWYADRTHFLAKTAEEQLRFQRTLHRIENKPIVFIDIQRADAGNPIVVVRNVGPGIAVNVYYVKRVNADLWSKTSIGALEARSHRRLPNNLEMDFELQPREARILLAEGMRTRTQQWIVSLNAKDDRGNVHHELVDFDLRGKTMTLDDLLKEHGERFQTKLTAFHEQVRK